MVTLAEFETIPVDTTIVAIKIAVCKFMRKDYKSQDVVWDFEQYRSHVFM